MSTLAAERRRGGLIDRRLAARVTATRRYLVTAVAAGLAATVCVVAQAVLLGTVVAGAVLHREALGSFAPQLAGLAAAFVARGLCVWAGEAAAQRTSAAVTSTLRRQLLRQALALGPAWLAGERAGELSLAATRGTAALDTYFGRYLPQAVVAGLAPAGILAWVGWEDWPSFLILLGLVALVPVAMIRFGRASAERTRRQWRRLSGLSARFLELLRGLPTLRAFGREDQGRREVAGTTEALRDATMSTLRVAFLSALALEFVAGIGTGLVAMVLGLRLLGGAVSLYTALAVLLVSPEVFLPLRRAGAEFHASEEGQAAAERILTVLDLEARTPPPGPAARQAVLRLEDQVLRLESVRVTFAGRAVPALDALDLAVGCGEHVALVGPSGSGKSTTIGLFLGFVGPDAGTVVVGGVDLSTIDPTTWRRYVSWVPQRPQLVHGTLADNLRLGDPQASDRRLEAVAEAAGLAPLLRGLPERLDTPVGEGGLTLSAGERQRVAIARAVLRDAPVVLLDEPVAHLDRFSEGRLRQALDGWLDGRTVLVAAHRPELVSRIDRVVELPHRELVPGKRNAGRAGGGTLDDDPLGVGRSAGATDA
jgi:thiol reductant ABC exporter CydD subunit